MKNIKRTLGRILKKIKIYTHYFKKITFKSSSKTKKIIICFDGLFPHGGLVDRLKGIISFYEISKQLKYEFYIIFEHPFDLTLFLEPNEVDWKLDRNELAWNPLNTKFIYLMNNFDISPLNLIETSNATNFIVYANIDYLNKIHPEIETPQLERIWRVRYNELFKRSKFLNDRLNQVEKQEYITIHARFTSLMGDFVDTTDKLISDDKKQQLLRHLNDIVKRIVENSKHKCYVFSDSIRFLNFIKENAPVNILKGVPFHMDDFKDETTIEKHLKTMIDFYMMVNSESVYFMKVDPMYHSSFSKYAAIIGDKPFTTLTN